MCSIAANLITSPRSVSPLPTTAEYRGAESDTDAFVFHSSKLHLCLSHQPDLSLGLAEREATHFKVVAKSYLEFESLSAKGSDFVCVLHRIGLMC